MPDKRWDLRDPRDAVPHHGFDLPQNPEKARRDTLERAGVSVVGDQEDSMVGRLLEDVKPLRRRRFWPTRN